MHLAKLGKITATAAVSFTLLFSSVLAAGKGVVNEESLKVYQSPVQNGEVLGKLYKEDPLEILSFEDEWVKILLADGESEGFVSSESVELLEAEAIVTNEALNIRNEPSENSEIHEKIYKGDKVMVKSVSPLWLKIAYKDGEAYVFNSYVSSDLLAYLPQESLAEEIYAVVKASGGLKLRNGKSMDAKVITLIPNGSFVDVLEEGEEWIKIITDDNLRGYVKGEFLTIKSGERPAIEIVETSNKGDEVVAYAKKHIGTPYSYGGTNLNRGVDCSGFVYSVYKNFNITLNRSSRDMVRNGIKIAKSELKAGDLVLFDTSGRNNGAICHVGIYMNSGNFIHSSSGKAKSVVISNLSEGYYQKAYVTARRILD